MEELEEHLGQAEEERVEKTTTLLDANPRPNPNVQRLQQKLARVERKAEKRQRKTLIKIKYGSEGHIGGGDAREGPFLQTGVFACPQLDKQKRTSIGSAGGESVSSRGGESNGDNKGVA